ncbi:MAG TPA: DUF1778 domain-containing protein [Alphaproteobacteria bacterium]|nr:DUF1778 domain-containing protein [Alphaproteobacteria bacterium]MDP6272008.1 DUF1778 domain-containing protein [Alphaproteobacteria bacterium]HJM49528.1 DUF1778 domain-containing protein [Alphaproteobacteria bacterium]
MTTASSQKIQPPTSPVQLRVPHAQKAIIDRAAAVAGQSRTEFMVQSSVTAAEDVLFDQRLFVLDDEAFTKFMAFLDESAQPNERLRRFMSRTPIWEK